MKPRNDREAGPTEEEPERDLRPARFRPGRRRRRLRWAMVLLVTAGLVAGLWGVRSHRASKPEVRRPGEKLSGVTDRLSRGLPAEAPVASFEDVTVAAGLGDFRTFSGERTSQLPEDMGSGAAWGDFDGDGDDDLFLVAAGGGMSEPVETWAASRLYENLGDGTFRPAEGLPELRISGMAAAWGDADGDGSLDLVVSGFDTLRLYRNEGDGRFRRDEDFPEAEGFWAGVTWGDFDGDGDLDLYVCGYVRYEAPESGAERMSQQYGAAVPYTLNPASFEPERNLLFVNRGDGRFDEAAVEWGVANPGGRSLSALWHDFDDDARLDLYVANDISDNALFLNRGDTFEDAGLTAWVADYRGAMGLAAGDWDRDGDDDLFVTHWLAQENALYDSRLRSAPPEPGRALLPRDEASPGQLTFSDLSAVTGLGPIALPLVGWGTEFVDLDADGWLDLLVANGSTVERKDDSRKLQPQRSMVLWNAAGEAFHDLPAEALAQPGVSRGLAVADYDGDGARDFLIVHLDGGVQMLRNTMRQGSSLTLTLRNRLPTGAWGRGEGATVVGWVGQTPLRRSVTGASYLSQSSTNLHFGLGEAEGLDGLEIRWPGGAVERHGPVAGNAAWEITEGDPTPRRLDGNSPARTSHETSPPSRERLVAFWELQRAAMDAMKREDDPEKAIPLFREALAIDPAHEDSRYYLAHCRWALGDAERALAELSELRRRSPESHRAHLRWATIQASVDRSEESLSQAVAAAKRAMEINREETGALLLLGQLELLRGNPEEADRYLSLVGQTNPRATGGLFLRAYSAWNEGRDSEAAELLERARESLGPEWKPEGTVAEGDVERRHHEDGTPLARFWRSWDGTPEPESAFGPLQEFLVSSD